MLSGPGGTPAGTNPHAPNVPAATRSRRTLERFLVIVTCPLSFLTVPFLGGGTLPRCFGTRRWDVKLHIEPLSRWIAGNMHVGAESCPTQAAPKAAAGEGCPPLGDAALSEIREALLTSHRTTDGGQRAMLPKSSPVFTRPDADGMLPNTWYNMYRNGPGVPAESSKAAP